MKRLPFLFACILSSFLISAWKGKVKDNNIPVFASVGNPDLVMKKCDFSKNAGAVVLFYDGRVDFIPGDGPQGKEAVINRENTIL